MTSGIPIYSQVENTSNDVYKWLESLNLTYSIKNIRNDVSNG